MSIICSAPVQQVTMSQEDPFQASKLTLEATGWDKCCFMVDRKKRVCKRARISVDMPVCTEHLPRNVIVNYGGRDVERISCPLDPRHNCFKHELEIHLTKCNSRRMEQPEYIKENVNLFIESEARESKVKKTKEERLLEAQSSDICEHGNSIFPKDKQVLETLIQLIPAYSKYINEKCSTECFEDRLGLHHLVAAELVTSYIGQSAARHLAQIGSIVKIMEQRNFFRDNTAFIEYGSGRGTVTFYIAQAVKEKNLKNCKIFLIDKMSPKHKQDNRLGDFGIEIIRIRGDIKDLSVGDLPGIQSKDVKHIVGFAKHLCGSATDMSVFSLVDKISNSCVEKFAGFCMATCCHHRCDFETYLGAEFIKENFKIKNYLTLKQMTSWAVDGAEHGRVDELFPECCRSILKELEDKYAPGLFMKTTIGEITKNMLDFARIEYVKKLNDKYDAAVVNFTDKPATLETRAIVCSLKT